MKFTVTMKDPDGFSFSVEDAVKDSIRDLKLSERELAAVEEERTEELNEKLRRWFEYGEYVRIEVDTEAMTATVVALRA
jgi:hypothetical protein